jgi:hypothetical protein
VVGLWLCAWLVASAAFQVLPRQTRARSTWLAWALPEWRFFAPDPCTYDYALFFRCFESPRSLHWVRFDARRHRGWLWNPGARRQKIFRDLVDALLLQGAAEPRGDGLADWVCRSDAYVLILAHCAALQSQENALQFGVVRVTPQRPSEVVFLSRWHECR